MKFVVLVAICLTVACSSSSPANKAASPARDAATPLSASGAAKPRIVFLGDSITAGLGLAADQSYPALIDKKIKKRGLNYEVVNGGVSGDTTAGGLRRADWSLDGDVKVLVLALGGNDALRGLAPSETKKNLQGVLEKAKARNIPVILAGMEAPPNNGADYTQDFRKVYADLAKEYNVTLIPFLLQGVAGDPSLNQADGIHPNIRGAEIVADVVWKALEPLLASPTPQAPSPRTQDPE